MELSVACTCDDLKLSGRTLVLEGRARVHCIGSGALEELEGIAESEWPTSGGEKKLTH